MKKGRKRSAKKKAKKPTSKRLDLKQLLTDLSEAQKELRQIQKRIQGLRALCQRPRVVKVEEKKKRRK